MQPLGCSTCGQSRQRSAAPGPPASRPSSSGSADPVPARGARRPGPGVRGQVSKVRFRGPGECDRPDDEPEGVDVARRRGLRSVHTLTNVAGLVHRISTQEKVKLVKSRTGGAVPARPAPRAPEASSPWSRRPGTSLAPTRRRPPPLRACVVLGG